MTDKAEWMTGPWAQETLKALEAAKRDEWLPEYLEAFEAMPVGSLADHYYAEIEVAPDGDTNRLKLLDKIIQRRGISEAELYAAWTRLADEQAELDA